MISLSDPDLRYAGIYGHSGMFKVPDPESPGNIPEGKGKPKTPESRKSYYKSSANNNDFTFRKEL